MCRVTIIAACLIIIFVSGLYSFWYSKTHLFSLRDYLKEEEKWDGKKIAANYQRVKSVGPDYFTIYEHGKEVKVIGEIAGIDAGDIISFKGTFHKDRTIKLDSYYVSKHRWIKYGVSIIATFLPFIWILANFKIEWKRLVLIEKDPCQTS